MTGRPLGSVVSIFYDGWAVAEPGSALRTTTGRLYLVLENRVQQRGMHVGRQHITALVAETLPAGAPIYPIVWYKRARRR